MSIMTVHQHNLCTIIEPSRARIDASNSPQYRDEILQMIRDGHHRLVINLSQVQFIDSSGLGMLVSIMKALPDRNQLVLCHIHDSVLGVFRLTRMDRVFDIVATQTDALNRLYV